MANSLNLNLVYVSFRNLYLIAYIIEIFNSLDLTNLSQVTKLNYVLCTFSPCRVYMGIHWLTQFWKNHDELKQFGLNWFACMVIWSLCADTF